MERTIPGKGVLYGSVEDLLEIQGALSSDYVVATVLEGEGAVGFELIQLENQETVIGLNPSRGNPADEAFSAQLASIPGVFFTSISTLNTSQEKRRVTFSAVGEDGSNLADPVTIDLPPKGFLQEDASQLFGLEQAVGSLRIEADGPGVTGDVLFGDPLSFNYAAALPLTSHWLREAVFSQVANTAQLFTGLAFYYPGSNQANVQIEVFRASGEKSGETDFILGAGERVSQVLAQLVPSTAGQIGGYIRIRSSEGIVAQQLFGESTLRLLSAVPPTVVQ